MTANTRLAPKLRFPEFRGRKGWEDSKLRELATVIAGQSPESTFYNEDGDGAPFYQGKSEFGDIFVEPPKKWTTQVTRLADAGDILMSVRAPVGAINVTREQICIGRGLAAIKARGDKWFLYYLLDSISASIIGNGGSVFDSINKHQIERLRVGAPAEPSEQRKVAACLGSLDDLIAAQGRKLEALRQHKQGLMQQLFPQPGKTAPRLRFPEFRDAGEWDEREVGEVFDVTRGKVLAMPLVKDERTDDALYPVYSSQTNNVGLVGYFSEYLYEDAITWTTDGANAGDVNYRSGKFYCTNVCGVLISDKGFANRCTASLINGVSRQHVSYIGNPKLMNGVMAKIRVPFPSLSEQQRIADCLGSLDDVIAAQGRKLDALQQHKQGLLQQLFPSLERITS